MSRLRVQETPNTLEAFLKYRADNWYGPQDSSSKKITVEMKFLRAAELAGELAKIMTHDVQRLQHDEKDEIDHYLLDLAEYLAAMNSADAHARKAYARLQLRIIAGVVRAGLSSRRK